MTLLRPLDRQSRKLWRPLALASALGLAISCASSAPFIERQRPSADSPWKLPASELNTQRVFRVRLESPEGRGRFRLLLRLREEGHYQIEATHPLFNRRLWSFASKGGQGLLVDYLQKVACRYEGEIEIAALPLGPFNQDRLPALLLGYPPLVSADRPLAGEGESEVHDRRGRRWTFQSGEQGVEHWILWDTAGPGAQDVDPEAEDAGRRAEWRMETDWAVLEARDEGIRVRWRETLREPAGVSFKPLEAPRGFDRGDCDLGWMQGVEGTWESADN